MELNKICRICLLNKYVMEDIFNIDIVIRTIAPIQLEKEDGLPSTICSDCLLQANQAYNFRQLCIKSDVILRQQVFIMIKKDPDEPQDASTIYSDNVENDDQINNEVNEKENTNESIRIKPENNVKKIEIKNNLICRFCDTQFDNRDVYIEHKQNHLKELKCHICGKTYPTYEKYTKHIYMHKAKGSFLCNVCGKIFTRKENLNMHAKIHSGIKPHKCSLCDKAFIQSNELKSHMVSHSNDKPYLCNTCGKRFGRIAILRHHIMSKHSTSPVEKPFVCACGKNFRDRRTLTQHKRRVHTTERKFICELCNKSFKVRKDLLQHEKIHKGDRPFACSLCDRAFIFKHVLQSHMNTHSKSTNTTIQQKQHFAE